MESYCLSSKVYDDDKEFLIQTANDSGRGIIRASLFADGELLDAHIQLHPEGIGDAEVLSLVRTAHERGKSELEFLLKSFKETLQDGQPETMFHLGMALFYKRMLPEARQLFKTATKLNPGYHEAHFFLSQAELALNHINDAINAGGRAVELSPDYADYRNNLGEAYLAAELCKRAVSEFDEAIKKNVYYADAYFNLAISHILNGIRKEDFDMSCDLTERCLDLFKKAILIYPDYQDTNYDQAISALTGGDFKKAYVLFRRARDAKKEKQRWRKAGYFHHFLSYIDGPSEADIAKRIAFHENEINRNPDYVDLYYEQAVHFLYKAKFNWQKGIDYFRSALSMNRNLKKAQRALDLSEEHNLQLSDIISDITRKDSS